MERPEQQRRAAVGGGVDQPLGRLDRAADEFGLEHEILDRIAGQLQFGGHDEVGALPRRLRADGEDRGGVAGEVADALVHLGKSDAKFLGHAAGLCAGAEGRNLALDAAVPV